MSTERREWWTDLAGYDPELYEVVALAFHVVGGAHDEWTITKLREAFDEWERVKEDANREASYELRRDALHLSILSHGEAAGAAMDERITTRADHFLTWLGVVS